MYLFKFISYLGNLLGVHLLCHSVLNVFYVSLSFLFLFLVVTKKKKKIKREREIERMDPGGGFSFKKVTWMTMIHHSSPKLLLLSPWQRIHTFCFLDTTDETMTTNKGYLNFIFKN